MGPRIGSLCSGYGGLDLGLMAVVGGSVAWHVEYDKHPSAVLDTRFPGVPNYGDLTKTDWTAVEPVDWLTAGYPCQPFSHAGKRRGSKDERHLWPFVADAISALRPRRVLLENVAGHVTLGLDAVLWDLATLGYDAVWGVVRAADAGAPHNRARLFILATDTEGNSRRLGDGNDVCAGSGADGRGATAGRSAAQDADSATRSERGLAAPRQAQGGRTRADIGGRGGASAADPNERDGGERYDADLLGRWTNEAEQVGLGDCTVADATGDGRDEGRAEPAGQLRRSDAAERGDDLCAECGCPEWVHDGGGFCAGPCWGECTDGGRRLPNSAYSAADTDVRRRKVGAEQHSDSPQDTADGDSRWGHAHGRRHADGDATLGGFTNEPFSGDPAGQPVRPLTGAVCRDSSRGTPAGVHQLGRAAAVVAWGPYEPAIRRWERISGRTAPRPTEPGRNGERLSPLFVEWMMGLPDGWVTTVLSRNPALKALGNGVVPQQAALAASTLLGLAEREVAA